MINKAKKNINGVEIEVSEKQIDGYDLTVQVGTNGLQGGDAGHGSRTFLKILSQGFLSLECKTIGQNGVDGFEVMLSGDFELIAIKEALKFALETLEIQSK